MQSLRPHSHHLSICEASTFQLFDHFSPLAPAYVQPLYPTSAFIHKNVITGWFSNDTYRKKPIKAITDSLSPPPTSCHNEAQSGKMAFPPFCAPHGLPHVIFSFFSDRMCWVECSFTHFKREIGNFFIFFFIFFHYFCPFSEKPLFGPFTPI